MSARGGVLSAAGAVALLIAALTARRGGLARLGRGTTVRNVRALRPDRRPDAVR
jgi:hypothetical protein